MWLIFRESEPKDLSQRETREQAGNRKAKSSSEQCSRTGELAPFPAWGLRVLRRGVVI